MGATTLKKVCVDCCWNISVDFLSQWPVFMSLWSRSGLLRTQKFSSLSVENPELTNVLTASKPGVGENKQQSMLLLNTGFLDFY